MEGKSRYEPSGTNPANRETPKRKGYSFAKTYRDELLDFSRRIKEAMEDLERSEALLKSGKK